MRKSKTGRRNVGKKLGTILTAVLVSISALWCFSMRWMLATWAYLSMSELVYHMNTTLEGTSTDTLWSYFFCCGLPALIALAAICILLYAGRIRKRLHRWTVRIGIIGALASAAGAAGVVWVTLDIGTYLEGQSRYSSFIDENYVDPSSVELTFPEEKRNLIYIYLESVEMTYADEANGGAFEENVIPELTQLALDNECFAGDSGVLNGANVTTGASWTMGALFAQTSGLPLNISIGDNSMDTQDTFFASAVTLGDILDAEGYNQVFLIGSDATFGGRRLYFTEHGGYRIEDYDYAAEEGRIPEDYRVWWGYEDEKLFEFARDDLLELSQEDEPFNLTILTVDTHFEDGYVCDLCGDAFGDNQYANVMACSSSQVAEFVEWIQEQDFYEDTTIVISGDHLTMDSDFCEDVDSAYNRRVYTVYINAAAEPVSETARTYTTLDDFPTTLAAMGVGIDGNRLGLGVNLFSDCLTLAEEYGMDVIENAFNQKSALLEELADIDESNLEKRISETYFSVSVAEIPDDAGLFGVSIGGLSALNINAGAVDAAVWTEDDQSDLQ
ncbi:MAG: LTA synthase family protein [Lachnospiraceae bacterium]|nr:LTA synthase family protein [Lachnospiraceae bacterium]